MPHRLDYGKDLVGNFISCSKE